MGVIRSRGQAVKRQSSIISPLFQKKRMLEIVLMASSVTGLFSNFLISSKNFIVEIFDPDNKLRPRSLITCKLLQPANRIVSVNSFMSLENRATTASSPPTDKAHSTGRPIITASAPSAIALKISSPHLTPLSRIKGIFLLIIFAISGSASIAEIILSICLPP